MLRKTKIVGVKLVMLMKKNQNTYMDKMYSRRQVFSRI